MKHWNEKLPLILVHINIYLHPLLNSYFFECRWTLKYTSNPLQQNLEFAELTNHTLKNNNALSAHKTAVGQFQSKGTETDRSVRIWHKKEHKD